MGPKPDDERADHYLFRTELLTINQRHELVRLAALAAAGHRVTVGAKWTEPADLYRERFERLGAPCVRIPVAPIEP